MCLQVGWGTGVGSGQVHAGVGIATTDCGAGKEIAVAKDRRKIEKKRKKEATKAKRAIAYAAAKKREAERPKVTVDPTGGDPVLVKRIQSIVRGISLEESGGCPAEIADLVARCMRDGPEETIREIHAQASLEFDHHRDVLRESARRFHATVAYVGERVLEELPDVYRKKLLPGYYFFPEVAPEGVRVRFGFLDRVKRQTGWGYYSQHKPTVTINGADWIVCFSEHAIDRIVERSSFEDRVTYTHYMDCANYLDGCVYFEPVNMADGKPAIRLFMADGLHGDIDRYHEYLRKITGVEDVNQLPADPAYVLGYCPLDCKGQFAKAISMLYPGYDGTPEEILVRAKAPSKAEQQRLLLMAAGNKMVRVINEGRHEAIRWYHENGVPQVVSLGRRLFDWAPRLTRPPESKVLPNPGHIQ